MLKGLDLEQFKCFDELHLPLQRLTLLTGINAAGKSSVMQSLVLMHQTMLENEWGNELDLNGTILSLGSAKDIINVIKGGNSFGIGMNWDDIKCFWTFEADDRRSLSVPITRFRWQVGEEPSSEYAMTENEVERLFPRVLLYENANAHVVTETLRGLVYIGAERIGPREAYSLAPSTRRTYVGRSGERAPAVLYWSDDRLEKPLVGLVLLGDPPTVQKQTEAWMRLFFPGLVLETSAVLRANLMTLGIGFPSTANASQRPQNVGYGVTHVLPIITALMVARKDDILLMENPEAHLHPAGQSLMGRLLAKAAAAGVQLIVETHSDHVLNGIRRAVREEILTPADVAIHFFAPSPDSENTPQVTSVSVNERGALDSWPEGFFDQFDKDISILAGWDE